MRPEPFTGARLWEAILADPDMTEQIPEVDKPIWRDLCVALIPTLEPVLDEVFTPQTLVRVTAIILDTVFNAGWIAKLTTYPISDSLLAGMYANMQMDRETFEQMTSALSDFDLVLMEDGVLFEEHLGDEDGVGFRPETLERWKQGGMTVRGLLLMQPSTLFRYN